jgi:ABC-type nitrate/sulfonate/bicarbonate transport system permease component
MAAGFIFGEMWNATDGVGFTMTVAGVTYETDRGMTAFIVLMLLFATIHMISALHNKDDVD